MSHHATCEGIASTCRIDDATGFHGIGREDTEAVLMRQDTSVFALLDYDKSWAHVENAACRGDRIAFTGELRRLAVVDDHNIDNPEQCQQLVVGDVDPEIHCVSHDQ